MHLVLKVVGGPSQGEKFLLRLGQVAHVGRTEWADFSVPMDQALDEKHFAVKCGPEACTLTAGECSGPVHINNRPMRQTTLKSGDRITAGESTFLVEVHGFAASAPSVSSSDVAEPAAHEPTTASPPPRPATSVEWCDLLELDDACRTMAERHVEPHQMLGALESHGFHIQAISLVGALLSKQAAVRWASHCVQQVSVGASPLSTAALVSAEAWADEPNESKRREAELAAQATEFEGPEAWVALAAFWSEGSIGPTNQPPVPAPPMLTAKAVTAALALAATSSPHAAATRYHSFLEMGRELLSSTLAADKDIRASGWQD